MYSEVRVKFRLTQDLLTISYDRCKCDHTSKFTPRGGSNHASRKLDRRVGKFWNETCP
jgi:hypothetical protein